MARLRDDVGRSPAGPERWVTKRLVMECSAKAVRVWERQHRPRLSIQVDFERYFYPCHLVGGAQAHEAKQRRL